MLVLTWNLFHGRAVPERRHALLGAFVGRLAGWDWDVALLQEVPPWWPPALGRAAGASARTALTSRNHLLCARRWVAERRPDLIRSGGGGANAILVRGAAIREHRVRTLRRLPERRVVHAVRLDSGTWVANLHATAHVEARAREDAELAARTVAGWAAGAPAVLGGDFNLRSLALPAFAPVAGHSVDHVCVRGLHAAGRPERPGRGELSDHEPLRIDVQEGSLRSSVF
ncbi:MAG: endonuclease/exonuclease/phosphatase family protein [Solirubrobacteraceae bacterium]